MARPPWYCPSCDRTFPSEESLREHFDRARGEGEENHMEIIELEQWDEPDVPEPS